MKKILIVLLVVVAVAVPYFSFAETEGKEDDVEKSFKETCKMTAGVLKRFNSEKYRNILPYETVIDLQKIKDASLNLIEDAQKIGPTDEGYGKLDKAITGTTFLLRVQTLITEVFLNDTAEKLQELEQLLKKYNKNKKKDLEI